MPDFLLSETSRRERIYRAALHEIISECAGPNGIDNAKKIATLALYAAKVPDGDLLTDSELIKMIESDIVNGNQSKNEKPVGIIK